MTNFKVMDSSQSAFDFTTRDTCRKPFKPVSHIDTRSVNLLSIIQNSMHLVKGEMSGKKKIIDDVRVMSTLIETNPSSADELETTDENLSAYENNRQKINLRNPQVLADDLLEDIFVIIYSDAAQYTSSSEVFVSTRIMQVGDYWKISISDKSKGVPSEQHANQIVKSKLMSDWSVYLAFID